MTIEEVKEQLGEAVKEDGTLYIDNDAQYIRWPLSDGDGVALEGRFNVEDLEAIVLYVRYESAIAEAVREREKRTESSRGVSDHVMKERESYEQ